MKKGISLIVLVITIIVMIIIAGAIILSLSSSNVTDKADKAVSDSDLANAKYAVSIAYADVMIANNDDDASNDYTDATAKTYYESKLTAAGYTGYTVSVAGLVPTVAAPATAS